MKVQGAHIGFLRIMIYDFAYQFNFLTKYSVLIRIIKPRS
jgi:hypothetical protein